jgi:microcystin-dependent protein
METTGQSATYSSLGPNSFMYVMSTLPAGSGLPHENRQPFLALNYIIALTGETPTV